MDAREARIATLLHSLDDWARQREPAPGGAPLADTGEARSRIQALIDELASLGVRVEKRGNAYVRVDAAGPGGRAP